MTDNVLQKYLSPSAGYDDESYDIDIPKTPEGIPPKDELDLLYNSKYEMEDSEDEKSPPASQMEPRHKTYHQNNQVNSLPKTSAENQKPSRKRKYVDIAPLETNIRKSKDSIRKLEEHTNKKTCPKSFQYTARANIPPDDTFLKEIKEIKTQAEQGFVSALARYHKRRLESQENKFKKAKFTKNSSKSASTYVNKSTREQSHSANTENIVNYDVNKVEKLQQDFNELKQILYTHVLQTSANNKILRNTKVSFLKIKPPQRGLNKVKGSMQTLDANSAEHTLLKNGLSHKENQMRDLLKTSPISN